MTYAAHPRDFHALVADSTSPKRKTVADKPSLLRRAFEAFTESRRRAANREIERFLARSGGRFSDDVERELMRRVATGDWNAHR